MPHIDAVSVSPEGQLCDAHHRFQESIPGILAMLANGMRSLLLRSLDEVPTSLDPQSRADPPRVGTRSHYAALASGEKCTSDATHAAPLHPLPIISAASCRRRTRAARSPGTRIRRVGRPQSRKWRERLRIHRSRVGSAVTRKAPKCGT